MYLHKENPDLLRDLIILTSEKLRLHEAIVEKDYYVTLVLKKLSSIEYPVVFKGGTSLSKAYKIIDRFSEDVDITFTEHLGEARRKKLKHKIIAPIALELGLDIKNFDQTESDKDLNHYDMHYSSLITNKSNNAVQTYVKLETALMSYAFPTETILIDNYIFEALEKEEPELIVSADLTPFEMSVQTPDRTLIDKLFAVCDYYMLGRSRRNSRHLYDIYKLSQHVNFNEHFSLLVKEVRQHRIQMGTDIAPSAPFDVNLIILAEELCKNEFYKDDFYLTTKDLISETIEFNLLSDFYLNTVKQVFQ